MNYLRRLLGGALLFAGAAGAWAQTATTIDPYVHEPLPAGSPSWMAEIYKNPSGVNFREMTEHFRQWLISDPNARAKTLEKKPAVNYFRRWRSAYERYVGDDGFIHLPTMEEHTARLARLNARLAHRKTKAAEDDKTWKNIGPYTVHKNGKDYDAQACVFRLTVYPKDPSILYAGTEMGVVFKTTDKGQTWQPCNNLHNFGGAIYSIQVDPNDPDIVYCGGGVNLWKTTDGGQHWELQSQVAGNVNSIRFSPEDSDYVTFSTGMAKGTQGGFYVTKDGGQTYEKTFSGMCHDHELKPGNPSRIYMLGKDSEDVEFLMRISDDGGMTFRSVPTADVKNIVAGRLAVSEAEGGEDYVYAIVNSYYIDYDRGPMGGMGTPYILRSTDGGETWENRTQCDGQYHRNCTFSGFGDTNGGQGYFDMIIAASPENPEHVIYGLTCCYRDEQGGGTSSLKTGIGGYVNRDAMHPDMQDIVTCGKDTWICTDGGIKYSTDFFATPGESRHYGIYASQYVGFGQGWNKDVMAGGRWHNGDAVMSESYDAGHALHVGGVEQSTGYVMLSNPHMVYFSDGSMCTVPEQDINGTVVSDYSYFPYSGKRPAESLVTSNELDFDPRYAHRIIINPSSESYADLEDMCTLYMSEDEGKSFRKIFQGDENFVQTHAHARSNPDHLYAVTDYSIYHSTDNGSTWTDFVQRPYVDNNNQAGAAIAVDPHDDNLLWYVNGYYKGQVAYTSNEGATWTYPLQGSGYENRRFSWIVLTGYKNGVYLSTSLMDYDEGQFVIYRDDDTDGWVEYANGFPPGAVISRLAPFYKEGKLRAATYQGIWEVPLYHEQFVPVAQPMALNLGHGNLTDPMKEVQFDSYSIVNQENATWEWTFSPKPYRVEGADTRNPKVVFGRQGDYDVTLTVTTPEGSHSRTIEKMISLSQSAPGTEEPPVGTGIASASDMPQIDVEVRYEAGVPSLVVHSGQLTTDKKFRLYSLKGALLQDVAIPASQTRTEVSLGELAPDVYLYNLSAKDYKYYGKFLKK